MTVITIEVPDELAARLQSMRADLPALLYEALRPALLETTADLARSRAAHPAYREMLEFLRSGPTPEEIISHHASPALQERLAELLERNSEDGLTAAEMVELDGYEQVNDLMSLLKARTQAANL